MPAKRSPRKKATRRKTGGKVKVYGKGAQDEILTRLSSGMESLAGICNDDHLPSCAVVLRWAHEDPEFRAAYDFARAAKAEHLADQAIVIADLADSDEISVANLRVSTRLKLIPKLGPRHWSERVALDHGGQDDNPVTFLELVRKASAETP